MISSFLQTWTLGLLWNQSIDCIKDRSNYQKSKLSKIHNSELESLKLAVSSCYVLYMITSVSGKILIIEYLILDNLATWIVACLMECYNEEPCKLSVNTEESINGGEDKDKVPQSNHDIDW